MKLLPASFQFVLLFAFLGLISSSEATWTEYEPGPLVKDGKLVHLGEINVARIPQMSNPPTVCTRERRNLKEVEEMEKRVNARLQRHSKGQSELEKKTENAEKEFKNAETRYKAAARLVSKAKSSMRSTEAQLRIGGLSNGERNRLMEKLRIARRKLAQYTAVQREAEVDLNKARERLSLARRNEANHGRQTSALEQAAREARMIVQSQRSMFIRCMQSAD